MAMFRSLLLLASVCCACVFPAAAGQWCRAQSTEGKKIIHYGWDIPDTAYFRQNIDRIDASGFDGVVISVHPPGGEPRTGGTDTLGWRLFGDQPFAPEDYEHAIEDLKATKTTQLTDNFIQILSNPGTLDWYDDAAWEVVLHNVSIMARVAKEGGCVGLMLDPEQYSGSSLWTYHLMPEKRVKAHSYAQYCGKLRQRGRQFMRAINERFPGATMLLLFGHSLPLSSRGSAPADASPYNLLAPFLDGMIEGADEATTLVDGYEFSYAFTNEAQFVDARQTALEKARSVSRVSPALFAKHVRVGFGLWADNDSQEHGGYHRGDDVASNYFTPAEWQSALHFALKHADKYVWIYNHRVAYWEAGPGQAYAQAMIDARQGPATPQEIARQRPPTTAPAGDQDGAAAAKTSMSMQIPHAADQPGHDDESTFGAYLRGGKTVVLDLPRTGWMFQTDPQDKGRSEQWQDADRDVSDWKPIEIGKFWEEQGQARYDGVAWYRLSFAAPADIATGAPLRLAIGAADESAWVWLNGTSVGEHDAGSGGWRDMFDLDVTGTIRPGAQNTLVIRVFDRGGAGGLWKSIKLVRQQPASASE